MWTEGWTGYCYVDRGLDRILLCGQRVGGCVDRVLDTFLLFGQRDGQTFAVWTEGLTDICCVFGQRIGGWQRVALILAVWTKDWRLCGQSGVQALPVWTEWCAGPSCVNRVVCRPLRRGQSGGQALPVWTEWCAGPSCVDRVVGRLLRCGQSGGQALTVSTEWWTGPYGVDRVVDKPFLCGQSGVQALTAWTEWWAGPYGVDRVVGRPLRRGQTAGLFIIKPRIISGITTLVTAP